MTATLNTPETTTETPAQAGLAQAPRTVSYGTPEFYRDAYATRARAPFLALPTAQDGLLALRRQIAAEARKDIPIRWGDVSMMPNGRISTPDGFVGLEPRAAAQFYGHATPGGAAYLGRCPIDLAAANVNRHLRDRCEAIDGAIYGAEGEALEEATALRDKPCARIRTRLGPTGERQAFAVVGAGYGALDADRLAAELASVVFPGSRVDIRTDGYRTRIDVLHMADIESGEIGQPHKAGVRVTTCDDGTGAFHFAAFVVRPSCANMAILKETAAGDKRRVVHRQSKATGLAGLAERVRDGYEGAQAHIAGYAEAWARAETETVLDGDGDPRKVFEALVTRGLVSYEGATRNEALDRLVSAWMKQGTNRWSKRAVVNAVTLAAHTNRWGGSGWGAEALEESAGRLLHQQVRVTLN